MPLLDWSGMPIHEAIKADWSTPEILIEGSLNCGKTTVALDKEVDALLRWPGIPILLFRWTDDALNTKLRPAFETVLNIREIPFTWNANIKQYSFENGSVVHAFGLKAVSAIERFNKIRGLGVARILGDQVEEMERAVAAELRGRLRPDLLATVRGTRFPFQLTFIDNPSDDGFWLSREFPTDNHVKGRKLYSLSVFDNPRLPRESVESLLRQYPEGHPKYLTMVAGRRGLNITGDAIYEDLYSRKDHRRELTIRTGAPFLEGFHYGTHNPVWVVAQRSYHGGLMLHGGIIGRRLSLEDFLPIVQERRAEWFPDAKFHTATAPMGETVGTSFARSTMKDILRDTLGQSPRWREAANAPDVQLTMIEYIYSLLRRRTLAREEAFGIEANPERWLEASIEDGVKPQPFMAFALEGGYVWSDHMVSVSNKAIRQPKNDDWYFNAMRCLENIVLNFCVNQNTDQESDEMKYHTPQPEGLDRALTSPNAWLY